ncbi:hypothetical protein [Spirosoma oryzicola]|uniref:hypothetical protein n=1 Tax=Spirosoma oryzicola TaxID=2898794 RepID=UPI001E3727A3|nr:hypothetical protein [Spirosoma oryzicola]UHG94672.1 hypothetical protein LQ777_29180 [Spirosoma oryzicola]
MITLIRQRDELVIPANFRGNRRFQWTVELLKQHRAFLLAGEGKHNFISSRWTIVKEQLWFETVNKCAYCEATTKLVAHGDVEHYRPKSIYWWLAYCYDNYLVSCQICNEVFKRDEFPIAGIPLNIPILTTTTTDAELEDLARSTAPDPFTDADGMPMADFIFQHQLERPYLLNPYFDNPDEYYAWKVDPILKQVSMVPVDDNAVPFVLYAETLYGLNRKELKELRFFFYNLYDVYRLTLEDTGISLLTRERAEAAIESMKHNSAPFAGMIRYFDRLYRP